MPAKGKRVASRQAQLNRRRRRQARSEADVAVQPVVNSETSTAASVAAAAEVATTIPAGNGMSTEALPQTRSRATQPIGRPQVQNRTGQALAYNHLTSELRRILILAGILTAVLLAVSFVL
jgi:NAD(P)H-dependent flavin oxidoreductase YrpB (nitropropane dioxygenase family)